MCDEKQKKSFCRTCGGSRTHRVVAAEVRAWQDDEAPVDGCDTWSILECRGCETVSFCHSHWFSEDTEIDENGHARPAEYIDLYPPAPLKRKPDWAEDLLLSLPFNEHWLASLYNDIYSSAGMQMYSLAAMGTRTIVDFVITKEAGLPPPKDTNTFAAKLNRVEQAGRITAALSGYLLSAFDAGSAAAHRGYRPTKSDLFTLLDIAENLLEVIYIAPEREKRRGSAATALKAGTPPRKKL